MVTVQFFPLDRLSNTSHAELQRGEGKFQEAERSEVFEYV